MGWGLQGGWPVGWGQLRIVPPPTCLSYTVTVSLTQQGLRRPTFHAWCRHWIPSGAGSRPGEVGDWTLGFKFKT